MKLWSVVGLLAIVIGLQPASAAAQSATSSAIAGVVKDATGAVLPGVTVEAASPALIEKVRTVVTDADGNYKIVDLRPGTYSVTFTLAGFATVKREGIALTSGFTAGVNADLKVGDVTETITVTGASPLVDVQNARVQKVLERTLLDSAPTSSMSPDSFSALTVGLSSDGSGHDVGGSMGERGGAPSYHGLNIGDSALLLDGMSFNTMHGVGGGSQRLYRANTMAAGEVNLGLGAQSAESATSGVQINYVPRDGGNKFSLSSNLSYANKHMASDNLDDTLIARGLKTVGGLEKSWDYGVAVGGPIKKDKVWFMLAPRWWGNQANNPGGYYNAAQGKPGLGFVPDLSKPAVQDINYGDGSARGTLQFSQKDKLTFGNNYERMCLCTFTATPTLAPEFIVSYHMKNNISQATWTRASNKLLLKAGVSYGRFVMSTLPEADVKPTDVSVIDIGNGQLYGSPASSPFVTTSQAFIGHNTQSNPLDIRFSASYVTGSHNAKFGVTDLEGWHNMNADVNQGLQYFFFNKFPVLLTEFASPFNEELRIRSNSVFAQDQWTLNKLTLNYGVRFDRYVGWVKPSTLPAGPFVDQRSFPGVKNVPNWKDINPRVSAAYDVFGNGKTALKGSWGRYVAAEGAGLTELNNPAQTVVTAANRTWFDANGNFDPHDDCDLRNPLANGTCGALSNQNFGKPVPSTFYADNVLHGWGARGYTWQGSVGIDQQLLSGLSLSAAYFRNSFGNILVANNTAVSASDFTQYCVTRPTDANLPGGGGGQICGLYDVVPQKFGQVVTTVQRVHDLGVGDVTRVYNSLDITLQGRFKHGAQLSGGVNVGRTVWNDCALNGTPQAYATGNGWVENGQDSTIGGTPHPKTDAYCEVKAPLSQNMQFKLNGVLPLPYDFQVSGVFQVLPGAPDQIARPAATCNKSVCATYTNAQILPSLGRNLSAGAAGTVVVPITVPMTLFEDRLYQLDFRATRIFRIGRATLKGNVDLYNAFNANTVTGVSGSYPAFLVPSTIMGARFVRFTGQIDF